MTDDLRPVERRILSLVEEGVDSAEIARRFKRSEAYVERVIDWTTIPRRRVPHHPGLRPIERRIIDLRAEGLSYDEIAQRFKKGPDHIRRVESYAHLRKNLGLA